MRSPIKRLVAPLCLFLNSLDTHKGVGSKENLSDILFSFGYLHEKSGLVRSGGLTMFNAFKRMFQPGV